MPRFPVLSENRPLLLFAFTTLFVLFPVRSHAQSPSITDVRNFNNVVDYTGALGQSVKISGANFGSSQGTSTVTFNGTGASVTTWGANTIYAIVPSGATSGNLVVTVGGVASNAKSFTVLARPNIVALRDVVNADSYTGAIGAWVKIGGGGFGTSQGSSTVTFNGTAVTTIDTWAQDSIYTYVPVGASSGNLVVTVGGNASNSISFTVVTGPQILTVRNTSNVDISSATVGTSVRILGGGFGTSQGSSTVKFNGTTATPTNWTASRIDAPVPSGATSGNIVITVGGTASNTYSFTVGPVVSSVTPTTGGAGTVVQISGSNFGSSQGSNVVKINGTSVGTASTWNNTSIVFTQPSGLSSGNLIVNANSLNSGSTSFTVTTTPTVYTVTPTTAGAGDIIQITGCNFGSSQSSNTVKINGVSIGAASTWQQGYISFTMPTGLSSGNLVVNAVGVDSNSTSFTVVQPSITSISPSNGAPNLHVTISGSHFGSSTGSVTFNGASASIYSWNSTQIVAIAPTPVTTGSLVATVGGVALNGGTFTAVTPPSASASAFPAANGSGWNNTNVTVSFTCTAGGLTITSCSTPQNVTSEGTGQIITGGATDSSGDVANASVTLNIDRTAPTLAVSSPSDGDSTSSSSITVSGTVSDSSSGLSGVTCNGSATTVTSGAFSCNISLNPGVNLIVIRRTDIAGNVAAAILHVTRTSGYTTTSLQVSPAVVNMVVGDTQNFNVVDQDGHVRADATWAVDDTSKATLPDANTPTLTAVATGDVTLTATIGSVNATATIHILTGTTLTDGTIRWSAPTASGYSVVQIVQAVPSFGGPDLFSIETGTAGILVRALTADGQQMWTAAPGSQPYVTAWPDNNGGLLMQLTPAVGSYSNLIDVDAKTGAQLWNYQTARQYVLGTTYTERKLAIGADGSIFDRQWTYNSASQTYEYSLSTINGQTGGVIAQYPLPHGTQTWIPAACNGNPSSSYPYNATATAPIIASDGTAYAAITVRNSTYEDNAQCHQQNTESFSLSVVGMTWFDDDDPIPERNLGSGFIPFPIRDPLSERVRV